MSNKSYRLPLLAGIGFTACLFFYACKKAPRYPEGLSVEESMKTFQLKEGFGVEPFATEPHVTSPVDMVINESGEVYVMEMPDYPYQADSLNPKGLVKFLKDTDGDGKVDTSLVFCDKLPSGTSMLPWKGGLIVTAAPDILYFKDTTGDHKADIRKVLFTGFFNRNSEAQITSLRFGVDNWIYANNNGQAGLVRPGDRPDAEPLNVGGGDFRFRLDRGKYEIESGGGQFGLAIDDWGNRFFTQNTLYIQQSPIPGRYLKRHAYLPVSSVNTKIYESDVMFQKTPPPYWRAERSRQRQQKYDSLGLDRTEWAEGHFTGASGGTFYGGDAFPDEYYGSIFTGEVAGNLVHRTVLSSTKGKAEFKAGRGAGEEDKEFLASTDPWFRPANLYAAPDGNLYVIDMYMQHIETPVSIPDELKADMDFEKGKDMGRIYRIFSKNSPSKNSLSPDLGKMTSAELVKLLPHKNQWWRLTAQRLLLERQDKSIIPAVKALINESPTPQGRLHALYVLEGLDALDAGLVAKALTDENPGIRTHAAILSERYPQNLPGVVALATDSSDRVVLQAALSLGQFPAAATSEALATILDKYAGEHLYRIAVLSSATGSSPAFIQQLQKKGFFKEDEGRTKFLEDAAYVVGARNGKGEVNQLLGVVGSLPEPLQLKALAGLGKGLKKASDESKKNLAKSISVQVFEQKGSDSVKAAVKELTDALKAL